MRLICPNCGAQYDIADDAISEGGRDVQCSNCAHTWFQTEKPVVEGRSKAQTIAAKRADATDAPAHTPIETPERKPLDNSISAILREELAHERKARAADISTPPATQADTTSSAVSADETRRRISRLTRVEGGTSAPASSTSPASVAAAATGAVAPDPNLRSVPSIEEINAALRARAEASDRSGLTEAEKQEATKRRGFRRGFFFVLILLVILITPYFFQSQINENLPQMRPYMATYVETVDQLRVFLNEQFQQVRTLIEGFTAGSDNAG